MPAWQTSGRAAGSGDVLPSLTLTEVAVPTPAAGEVLIEVWAAGLGLADVEALRRATRAPFTPGLELCGEVVGVGEGVSRTRLGERVVGVTRPPYGALARYALARALDVLPAPTRLDDAAASVFHVAHQTGWLGLYRRAGLRVGEVLVVHAAAGGLGSAAVQLGRAAGAKVIAVVGAPEKVGPVRRLGADVVLDRSAVDVVAEVLAGTGGAGADVVYDPVGGPALTQSTKLVAFEGRIVVAGFAAGRATKVPTDHLRGGNYTLVGLDWRAYLESRPELVVRAHADLSSLAEVGAVHPMMAGRPAFADAGKGLAQVAAGAVIGRLAVSPPP